MTHMQKTTPDLSRLFLPQSVAVVGASTTGDSVANRFLCNLRKLGFNGAVTVVHPKATEIEGFSAVPRLADLPHTVDYAYISVAADRCAGLFDDAQGKLRFAQIISSGFAETGEHDLQAQLVATCKASGTRIIGPNCIGTHSSAGKISFHARADQLKSGPVGIISQSGGLSTDILTRGSRRGLGIHSVVSVGNSADLGPVDILEHMLDDPQIRVIGMYLEDIADGRSLFQALRRNGGRKPVVLLKGGRTAAGQRASMSHTGALMADDRVWQALAAQTGLVLTDSLDRFVNSLLVFQTITPRLDREGRNVALFGNGGGTSVLAADAFSRAGFEIPALSKAATSALEALQLPPGTSIANPIDAPGTTLRLESGKIGVSILEGIMRDQGIDVIVSHINMSVMLGYRDPQIVPNFVEGIAKLRDHAGNGTHLALVLRSGGEPEVEEARNTLRERILSLGIPVFDELEDAAWGFAGLAELERFLTRDCQLA